MAVSAAATMWPVVPKLSGFATSIVFKQEDARCLFDEGHSLSSALDRSECAVGGLGIDLPVGQHLVAELGKNKAPEHPSNSVLKVFGFFFFVFLKRNENSRVERCGYIVLPEPLGVHGVVRQNEMAPLDSDSALKAGE